jgi:glucose-fructose oxidoreductase
MHSQKKVRYAVIGLGHIAQIAVLPGFKHASENSELVALISDDVEKLSELCNKYKVAHCWTYEQFDDALSSGAFDAIYIALPNDMHKQFAIKAAQAGVHVLCEKPMGITAADCQAMINAAKRNSVKLMIAYRLHFERTNMTAVHLIQEGRIGTPRIFNSTFTMQVREGNIRTQSEHGGGPLNDIGIYCINAARYLFQDEPRLVVAIAAKSDDPRFSEIEESVSAVMKFPGEKVASFTCSFGAADTGRYEVIGTEGCISLDPAYDYAAELEYRLNVGDKAERHKTPARDQFAPELLHFSKCILENKEPRPSGEEGLNDLRVIEAIRQSVDSGEAVRIKAGSKASQPDQELVTEKPGIKKPELVKVESSSK